MLGWGASLITYKGSEMRKKSFVGVFVAFAVLAAAGVAGATVSELIRIRGKGHDAARVVCPGGMTNMGYELNEQGSVFPFDPATQIDDVYTVDPDFFEVERVSISSHAGTHLDVPRHFIEGARGLTDLNPEEFVWPVYKIVISEIDLDDGQLQLTKQNIRDYERENGRIKNGSLVVLDTSVNDEFGLDDVGPDGTHDMRVVADGDFADNVDDLFNLDVEGLSVEAINFMFEKRGIAGVGTDAYGPDATDDTDFLATFTVLDNGGVALVALDNVESLSVSSDVIMAPAVRLSEGSGFPTNPIACHGAAAHYDNDQGDDDDDDD